jgi:radical SAM superfamily enzyme YgiQ (UPF0313 family)
MRLLLVYPGNPELSANRRRRSRRVPAIRLPAFHAIGLPVIAAATPPGWDIELVNEEQGEQINFDGGYDLVGLSSMTSQAPRAYQIADEFRRRGVKVVHGGSHPTVCREEALEHGDAVVAGEGERSWPRLVADFTAGRPLRRVYEHEPKPDEPWYVPPRRSLLNTKGTYPVATLLATRGCPFTCRFCTVSSVFGRGYRHRPVDEVVAEVRALGDAGHRHFIFLDDNIIGSPNWAREFFTKMAPLKVYWGGQAHLGSARDPELIRLASKSGMLALFIGIESVSRAALIGARKSFNDIARYREWVKVMHDNGIVIIGGMIFGFDEDDPSVFARTLEVIDRLDIAAGNFSPLIPLPGTDTYRKLSAEGRILDHNWAHYDGSHVVFRPAQMTPEQLDEGSDWAGHTYFSPSRIIRRFGSNWRNPIVYWFTTLAYMFKERSQHGKGSVLPISGDERRELLDSFGLS